MADPTSYVDIDDARTSKWAAQWWLLYAILVANKSAEITRKKLEEFLESGDTTTTYPFESILCLERTKMLEQTIRTVRTGQYNRIAKAFRHVVAHTALEVGDDPRLWSLDDLESIPGVGPKTARWYYLLINPDAHVAALDTHVLKFLRDNGVVGVPKATPARGALYKRLESEFVEYAQRLGLNTRDMDFFIWAVYRNGGKVLA